MRRKSAEIQVFSISFLGVLSPYLGCCFDLINRGALISSQTRGHTEHRTKTQSGHYFNEHRKTQLGEKDRTT